MNNRTLRHSIIVMPLTVLACLGSAVAAQDQGDWTPSDYASLEKTALGSSDESNQPIAAITINPASFEDKVSTGYASFVTLVRAPLGITEMPRGIKEIFVRNEYFRDQISTADGGHTYRSVQQSWIVDCDGGQLALNGFTRFERNETEGSAVYFEQGTTEFAKLNMKDAVSGRSSQYLVRAACEAEFIYSPEAES